MRRRKDECYVAALAVERAGLDSLYFERNGVALMTSFRQSLFLRFVCLFMAATLFVQSSAAGYAFLAAQTRDQVLRFAQGRPGAFSHAPGPIFKGSNPGRDPIGRGGWWTPKLLADRAAHRKAKSEAKHGQLIASIENLFTVAAMQHGGGGGGGQGEGEGEGEGGGTTSTGSTGSTGATGQTGSSLNTHTGNKHTPLGIVGWPDKGDVSVGLVLHHNSLGNYSSEFGEGWTHSYDWEIAYTPYSSAIVRSGAGLEMPYTEVSGVFTPPAGVHDSLVLNGNGTWTLTTKRQWKLEFNDDGFLVAIKDRANNQITIGRDGSNKITTVTDNNSRALLFSYGANGLVDEVEDPLERIWTFAYDGNDDLTDVTYPLLDSTAYTREFTYDAGHNILTETDLRGKTWTFTYDGSERLTSFTNPLNKTWSASYSSSAVTMTNPLSGTVVHNYSAGMLASEVDENSYSVSYVYDGDKNVTQFTDQRSKVWTYTYDSDGNVLTETNPLSKTWEYTYNGTNDLLSVESPLGNDTAYTYNGVGKVLEVEDGLTRTAVTNTYDSYGQLLTTEDALGRETELTYDTYGNVTNVESPDGTEVTNQYDLLGRPTSVTDAANATTTTAYDDWGRVATITQPGSAVSSLSYDAESNVIGATDALSRSGSRTYDDAGRLTASQNARGDTESYSYDHSDRLTGITNGRSYTRTYTYTSRGDVASLTLPDSSVESWTYDGTGNTTAYTNPLSQTISYTYDNAGRQTGVDYPTGTDTTFGYDDDDRTSSMVDATGTTSWTYNAADELTELDQPNGTVEYTYNSAGQRATMVDVGVGTTTYGYDAYGRLSTITNPYSEVTTFAYDAAGRISQRTLESDAYDVFTYDTRSRVTGIVTRDSEGNALYSRAYTFNAVSNVTQVIEGGVTTTYTYDNIDQLTGESRSGYTATYTYDANGNRLTKTVNSVTENYSYDSADKLLTAGSKTYDYDDAGRTTEVTSGGVTTYLAYDYEGRVTSITKSGVTTNSFAYNGLDTRVSKTDSAGTKTYRRAGAYVTDPVLGDGSANFTPGISERRSSTTTYLHSALKNADVQTANLASVTGSRRYDAFGNVVSSSGTWQGPFGNAGGFGYQEDSDHGLKLLGHRYYDSSTGRFLTRDTAKDGRNWYVYCANNSVNGTDPDGQRYFLVRLVFLLLHLNGEEQAANRKIVVDDAPTSGYQQDNPAGFPKGKPSLDPKPPGGPGEPGGKRPTRPQIRTAVGALKAGRPFHRPPSWVSGRSPGSGGALGAFFVVAIALNEFPSAFANVLGWSKRTSMQAELAFPDETADVNAALRAEQRLNERMGVVYEAHEKF